jgi:ATP-dependent helicase/nuclease subunit A
MSIHQSKGLEFPIVALPDLGKRFNLSGPRGGLILDESYGLCLGVKPPGSGRRYPSLPLWLVRNRQRQDALGEELRLLYVALTRARDTLILTGSCPESSLRQAWPELEGGSPPPHQLSRATSYLDWLGPWLAQQSGAASWPDQSEGATPLWLWKFHRASRQAVPSNSRAIHIPNPIPTPGNSERQLQSIRDRLSWIYPHAGAVQIAGKSSVTALKHSLNVEPDEDAQPAGPARFQSETFRHRPVGRLAAAQIGTAHLCRGH